MRWKTTLVLLIVTVGLGSYVSLYELKQPPPEQREALAKEVVRLAPEDVTSLMVECPQAKVSLQRRNGSWRLVSPLAVRADDALVRRLANELDPLEAERALESSKDTPLALGDFGLAPPQATLVAIAGNRAVAVWVGKTTAVGANRYLKLADSPKVFVASSRLYDAMNHSLDAYRSHELLDVDTWSATRIAVTSPHASYALSKQTGAAPAGAGHWQLTEPLVDEADGAAVSATLSKLSGLRVERFVSDAPTVEHLPEWGFDTPSAHITVALDKEAKPLELFVGKPTADKPEQVYAKRTDEPTIYAVAKERVEELLQDPQGLRARTALDFFAHQVAKVRVSWQNASWTMENGKGQWELADGHRALDGSKVDEWLSKLRGVTLTRFVEDLAAPPAAESANGVTGGTDQPQHTSRYGLDPPKGTIQVWLTDQQEPKALFIGDAVDQGMARYGRIAGRASVIELPDTILGLLTTTPESFAAQAASSPPKK